MNERFSLKGTAYYQQGRKCSKPGCHCAGGELHGPYWYARSGRGKVRYIGKTLPENIVRMRRIHDRWRAKMRMLLRRLIPVMVEARRQLIAQADRLARLIAEVSGDVYGPDFNDALKRAIRERDGYKCMICGIRENGRALHVHHIDYDKAHNETDNLIALCPFCHAKTTNGDRDYWQKKLSSTLLGELEPTR